MTIVDHEIRALCRPPMAMIEPYVEDNLQPASYDITLSRSFKVPRLVVPAVDLADPETFVDLYEAVELGPDQTITLESGGFVLGATVEHVRIPKTIVGRIEGRSSLGRLGLLIHATAGYLDPGFHGNVTLEICNLLRTPIILHPGHRIGQLSFSRCLAPERTYAGRYQSSSGCIGSRFDG